jgi:hypothetical protein
VGNWLNLGGGRGIRASLAPLANPGAVNPGPSFAGPARAGSIPPGYQPPYQYQAVSGPYQAPFTPPAPGFVDPAMPLGRPQYWPPLFWRRKEPIGAIVLIGLGLLFLLDQLDIFNGRLIEFSWPLLLIGLGVWLIVRRRWRFARRFQMNRYS